MIFTDAHCHLQDPALSKELTSHLKKASTFGIHRFIVNSTCPDDWEAVSRLAKNHADILPQFGVHPWKVENLREVWEEQLKAMLLRFPNAGIGEIGLDGQLTDAPMELQLRVFQRQLEIACSFNRPCTIHAVKAWSELIPELEKSSPPKYLLHSFGGSPEQVNQFVEKGAYFSFGGAVIRQSNSEKLKNAVREVPDDRLLLETDSPFQHPQGKSYRQEPAGLLKIAERVAELRGVNIHDLSQQTERNLGHFFN